MYSLLVLLSGSLQALMLLVNGALSAQQGLWHATLYIHIVGTLFAAAALALARQRTGLSRELPAWMYLGGVIGVAATAGCSFAATRLSLGSVAALNMFSQLAVSCLVDRFGLFGMKRQSSLDFSGAGLLLSALGIVLMLGIPDGDAAGIFAALAVGGCVVVAKIVNGFLAERTSALQGSFINHLAGVPVCLVLALLIPEPVQKETFRLWIWCGGMMGVIVVLLNNLTVLHLSSSRLTLLTLCGQLFCGLVLDALRGTAISELELFAALLVAAGIAVWQLQCMYRQKKAREKQAYYEQIAQAERAYWQQLYQKSAERAGSISSK